MDQLMVAALAERKGLQSVDYTAVSMDETMAVGKGPQLVGHWVGG
jgi:hypothetical protein